MADILAGRVNLKMPSLTNDRMRNDAPHSESVVLILVKSRER